MKTMKRVLLCFCTAVMLLLMGTTVSAGTTYGYLNRTDKYNTKSLDLRYHAVAPTKFTISVAVAGKVPVSKLRIYNYTANTYKDFDSKSKYWSYNAAKNVSVFACGMTVSKTGDIRLKVMEDAGTKGRIVAVKVNGSIEKQPANVSAKAMSTSEIQVSWTKIPGVTGYYVYRKIGTTGTYEKLGIVKTNACKASGLKAGTAYYYKIRAYYKSGNEFLLSKWSSAAGAKTLAKPVYTNKLTELKSGTTYKAYDVTGDGKADSFKYSVVSGKAKVYIGGSYKQEIDLVRGGTLYYCGVDRANSYIIANCGQTHGNTLVVYKYISGKFKSIGKSESYGKYLLDYATPVKISGNVLTINTTPCTLASHTKGNGGAYQSFSDKKMKDKERMGYQIRFKLADGKMSLYSKLCTVTGRVGYYAKNSFRTSASNTKMTVKDGPIVTAGQKVKVTKLLFVATTSGNYKKYFQIEVNGKTGWFEDSKNILFRI